MNVSELEFSQFQRNYHESSLAQQYYKTRTLSQKLIDQNLIGFCPPYSRYVFPLLRGRLIVPIRDVHGRLIALAGRQLPDYIELTIKSFWDTYSYEPSKADDRISKWMKGKWINEPYQKSKHLFNLDKAKEYIRESNFVYIVEGYFDVLVLRQNGINNVVALCGTALSDFHLALLYRYCNRIVLLLDGDIAGKLATDKIFQKLSENNFIGKSLYLPEKCDPDDFVIEYGPENLINATKELLNSDSSYLNILAS